MFKINTRSYYRKHLRDVDASVTLDGLTAHEEYSLVSQQSGSCSQSVIAVGSR